MSLQAHVAEGKDEVHEEKRGRDFYRHRVIDSSVECEQVGGHISRFKYLEGRTECRNQGAEFWGL
jgi:hypothetical protein